MVKLRKLLNVFGVDSGGEDADAAEVARHNVKVSAVDPNFLGMQSSYAAGVKILGKSTKSKYRFTLLGVDRMPGYGTIV